MDLRVPAAMGLLVLVAACGEADPASPPGAGETVTSTPTPAKPKKIFAFPKPSGKKGLIATPHKAKWNKGGGYVLSRKPSGPSVKMTFAPDMVFRRVVPQCDDYLGGGGLTVTRKGAGKTKCDPSHLPKILKQTTSTPLRIVYRPSGPREGEAIKIVEYFPCQGTHC